MDLTFLRRLEKLGVAALANEQTEMHTTPHHTTCKSRPSAGSFRASTPQRAHAPDAGRETQSRTGQQPGDASTASTVHRRRRTPRCTHEQLHLPPRLWCCGAVVCPSPSPCAPVQSSRALSSARRAADSSGPQSQCAHSRAAHTACIAGSIADLCFRHGCCGTIESEDNAAHCHCHCRCPAVLQRTRTLWRKTRPQEASDGKRRLPGQGFKTGTMAWKRNERT